MYTNTMRFTGLSGIDTESMVTQLMQAESYKYERLKAELQILQWTQDAYRGATSTLQDFQNTYFSMASSSNIVSSSNFTGTSTSTILDCNGNPSTAVSVSSYADGVSFDITSATMAQNLEMTSSSFSLSDIEGDAVDFSNLQAGDSFNITLDGTSKTITLTEDDIKNINKATSADDKMTALTNTLNSQLTSTFGTETSGESKVSVSAGGDGNLVFTTTAGHDLTVTDSNSRAGVEGETKTTVTLDTSTLATSILTNATLTTDDDGKTTYSSTASVTINGTEYKASFDLPDKTEIDVTDYYNDDDGSFSDDYETKEEAKAAYDKAVAENDEAYKETIVATALQALTAELSDVSGLSFGYSDNGDGTLDLSFQTVNTSESFTVSGFNLGGGTITLNDSKLGGTSSLSGLGITSGSNNKLSTSEITMGDIWSENDGKGTFPTTLTLGDTTIDITADMTFKEFSDALSGTGYSVSYSNLSNKFTFSSEATGQTANIDSTATDTLNDIFGFSDSGTIQKATDLVMTINGVETSRDSNKFTYDGVTMTINEDITKGVNDVSIKVSQDIDTTYDNIVNFVNAYNDLVDSLKSLTSTNRPTTSDGGYYTPLTDDEKAAMSSSEIELWEASASSGLLYNDSLINGILTSMRSTMYESVPTSDGGSIALYEIGITTSSDWTQGGKLVIDESKLRTAIEERGSDVTDLFTQTSDIGYTTNKVDSARMSTQGLASRLDDIIKAAVYNADSSLQAKAGIASGVSVNNNIISKQIDDKNDAIATMYSYLVNKENSYYAQFSYMEQAVMNANSQLSYLLSMM